MKNGQEIVRPLPRFLPPAAWASFVLNVLIIATGGAVRLTGSGLGCDQWPLCTPGSLVPTPELGIHGIIEFGNRTISGPLLLAAILVLVLGWRIRNQRRELSLLSWVILILVLVQAVVGGVLVLDDLAAFLVGFHYTVSVIIVCLTAAYLGLMNRTPAVGHQRELAVPKPFMILTHITSFVLAVTVIVGVMTTASGPHSGDENVVRQGFDASILAHFHAWPGYALLALTAVLLVWAILKKLQPLPWVIVLFVVQLVQVAVGLYQARNGLPPLAVGVHMVLAALTAATMTVVILRLKQTTQNETAEANETTVTV